MVILPKSAAFPFYLLLAAVLCSTASCSGLQPTATGIQVLAGTYGQNCGQPHGNKTAHLASICSGRGQCEYIIDHTVIGDPAFGCPKDYIAEWQCPGSLQPLRAHVGAEAGFRSKIVLSCAAR
jgi:hypothetical protein